MEITQELIDNVRDIVTNEYSGGVKGTELVVRLWEKDVHIDANGFLDLIDFILKNESCGLKVLKYTWDSYREKNFIYTP